MPTTTPFAGQKCIVTGANRGIGLALTQALLHQGAHVFAGVRDVTKAAQLQQLHQASNSRLHILRLDVSDDAQVRQFVNNLPDGPFDVVINNAGVNLDGASEATNVAGQVMLDTFNINAVGPLRLIQAILPKLLESKSAKVANISSIMGSIAENGQGGVVAYRTSKTALNMITKCLALAEPNVIFLTMHPGWVQTEMGGAHAPVNPRESAFGLLTQIAAARSQDSGSFIRFDGERAPW